MIGDANEQNQMEDSSADEEDEKQEQQIKE